MKTLRIFRGYSDARTNAKGHPPVRTTDGLLFKSRKSRLVSHPTEHLFAVPDDFSYPGMRILFWHYARHLKPSYPIALFVYDGRIINGIKHFSGLDKPFVQAVYDAIWSNRVYLGETGLWTDDSDPVLVPYNPGMDTLENAVPLPGRVLAEWQKDKRRIGL